MTFRLFNATMNKDQKLATCVKICIAIALFMMIVVALIGAKVIGEMLGVMMFTALAALFAADMIWMVMLLKQSD